MKERLHKAPLGAFALQQTERSLHKMTLQFGQIGLKPGQFLFRWLGNFLRLNSLLIKTCITSLKIFRLMFFGKNKNMNFYELYKWTISGGLSSGKKRGEKRREKREEKKKKNEDNKMIHSKESDHKILRSSPCSAIEPAVSILLTNNPHLPPGGLAFVSSSKCCNQSVKSRGPTIPPCVFLAVFAIVGSPQGLPLPNPSCPHHPRRLHYRLSLP